MPSRLHGISLGWLLTVKASQFSEKFNPLSLGFADHTNFAPVTNYVPSCRYNILFPASHMEIGQG
jgi:hypothetical protein